LSYRVYEVKHGKMRPVAPLARIQRSFCIVLPFHVWGRPYILIVDDNRNQASYPAMQGG
jgi:hypothetical protein